MDVTAAVKQVQQRREAHLVLAEAQYEQELAEITRQARIDEYRDGQHVPALSAEAVRRLSEQGLL